MRGQTLVSLAGPCAPLRAACTCVFVSQPQGTTSHRDTSSFVLVKRNCRRQTAKPEGCWEWVVGADMNRQAPSGGQDMLWGLPESLPPPPAAPPPVESLAPEGVCSPGLEYDSLGEGAEQLACWGERVSVLISLGTPLRLARGFCVLIPECVEGLRGPLGFRWGRGAGLPQLIPGWGGIRGLRSWPWVPWATLG